MVQSATATQPIPSRATHYPPGTAIPSSPKKDMEYPSTDGEPLPGGERQFKLINYVWGGVDEDLPDTCVAADMFWYPVQGHPEIRLAPDVFGVPGRPRADRDSYLQWKEENIPPKVVFEIWSASDRWHIRMGKFKFYDMYGVDEFYSWDPEIGELGGCLRDANGLQPIAEMNGWVSPCLGIRFEVEDGKLRIFHPNGEPFLTREELVLARKAEQEARVAAEEKARQESARAEQESARAEQESARAGQESARADRLAALLRAAGINTD